MSAFNPWLGFPARKAVYLDLDFDRQRGNGQAAYGTTQTAYDAANALQLVTGQQVVIMVGSGSFGNLALTAAHNSNVIWCGINRASSIIGSITSSDGAGTGFAVTLTFSNLTIGAITTSGLVAGGNVTLNGSGIAITTVGSIDTSSSDGLGGGVNAGSVTLTNVSQTGSINTTGEAAGGAVTLVRSLTSGALTVDSGSGDAGAVSLDEQSTCGNISSEGNNVSISVLDGSTIGSVSIGGSASDMAFTIRNGSKASNVTLGGSVVTVIVDDSVIGDLTAGNSEFILTARDSKMGAIINPNSSSDLIETFGCMIDPSGSLSSIEKVSNGCVFSGVVMRTNGGNAPCIADASAAVGGTCQFIDVTMIPNGTGLPVVGGGTAVILAEDLRVKNDFDGSVTVNGNYIHNGAFLFPG